jgi:hypothetical protein
LRVCHSESSGKPTWLEIKQYTSAVVYADDVNKLGRSIHAINKNTQKL